MDDEDRNKLVIQHNLVAISAGRQNGITDIRRKKSSEKLSSGYRINRAADDAAGLAMSEKMRRQIRGLTQASENCMEGISLIQVADGAMAEIHDMLHRGSELSIKAANDTLTTDDRRYIQAEISQILNELDSIREKATFNEIKVLCGGDNPSANYKMVASDDAFLMGAKLPDTVSSAAIDAGYMCDVYEENGKKYPAGTIDFTGITADNAKDLIGTGFNIDCSTCSNKYTFSFTEGSGSSTEVSGSNYIYKIGIEGVTSGNDLVDRIISAATAEPAGHYTTLANQGGKLLMHENREWPGEQDLSYYQRQSRVLSGEAYDPGELDKRGAYDLLIQAGSEADQTIPIRLPNVDRRLMGLSYIDVTRKGEYTAASGHFDEASGSTASTGQYQGNLNGPAEAITRFKGALEYISRERSRMGACQNRLEHAVRNLDNVVENTTASESRIRDTDMASEMQRYANIDVIAQAGQTILAQANQSKQGVLGLLQ